MPWDGSGNFTLTQDFPQDRDLGRPNSLIDADKFASEFSNIKSGLENCLTKDGQNEPTDDIPMGGHTLTGLRAAAAPTEPVIASQVSSGTYDWVGTVGGTANAITATLSLAPTLAAGVRLRGIAASTNTGSATFRLNLGSLVSIVRYDGTALQAGDIQAGSPFELLHDGTNWRLTSLRSGSFSSVTTLNDIFDVVIASPLGGQVLKRDGSLWVNDTLSLVDDFGASADGETLVTAANYAAMRALLDLEVGTDIQAFDQDLTTIGGLTPNNDDIIQRKAGVWANRTMAQLIADLAALGTTFQPLDSDLSAIGALTPSDDDIIQRKAGAWTNRTIAQLGADLGAANLFQPIDADLTNIAALSTTNYGRSFLTLADAIAACDYISSRGSDIASSSTINLSTATGLIVDVTGTTTITAITLTDGDIRIVRFAGALTLTNGASLILPGGANITTAAGDVAIFAGYASSVVRCLSYVKANGKAVIPPAESDITGSAWTSYTPTVTAQTGTITTSSATGRYKQIGKIVVVQMDVILTTVGTATGSLIVSLPVTAASNRYVGSSFEYNTTGKSGAGFTNTTTEVWARDATGATFFVNGYRVAITLTYEAA